MATFAGVKLVDKTRWVLKELKNFVKVKLNPGESKVVTFELTPAKLSFYKEKLRWILEAGAFKVMVGKSSSRINLESSF